MARVGRVVLLHPDVNFDGTFRSLSVCAQVVFLRLLPFLDDAGRLPTEKGIGLTANIHHRLGLPPADLEGAVAELVERQMIRVEAEVLSVPKFAARQRDAAFLLPAILLSRLTDMQSVRDFLLGLAPLFERAGLRLTASTSVTDPVPSRPGPERSSSPSYDPERGAATVVERVPRVGRTTVPRIVTQTPKGPEVESDADYAKRLRTLRNQRYNRKHGRCGAGSAEASSSSDEGDDRLPKTLKTEDVEDASTSSERLPSSSSVFGSELSHSGNSIQTGTLPPTSTSYQAGLEEDGAGRRKTVKTEDEDAKTYVPSPAPPSSGTMLGDEVAQQIGRATAGLFFASASSTVLRELGRVNLLLNRQGTRADRWEIFGAYILAGGYASLNARRFRRRVRGATVMVPDLDMLIKALPTATEEGGQVNEMDTSRLMRGLNSALAWDEQGRPDLRVRGADNGRGGLEKVAAPSDASGRAAGDALVRGGATGSSAAGAVSVSGAAADDLLAGILGGEGSA